MVSAKIYVEGGGDTKEMHSRCREGFRKLMERCGLKGRLPRLIACGGRDSTYDDFRIAHDTNTTGVYIALLVDSEDTVTDIGKPWVHLKTRDKWDKPVGATDAQALLMATCMETWIVADRPTLRGYYGGKLKEASLPSLVNLESRNRQDIQDGLCQATSNCKNMYEKGRRSFELVGELDPAEIRKYSPSFVRFQDILKKKL